MMQYALFENFILLSFVFSRFGKVQNLPVGWFMTWEVRWEWSLRNRCQLGTLWIWTLKIHIYQELQAKKINGTKNSQLSALQLDYYMLLCSKMLFASLHIMSHRSYNTLFLFQLLSVLLLLVVWCIYSYQFITHDLCLFIFNSALRKFYLYFWPPKPCQSTVSKNYWLRPCAEAWWWLTKI